NPSYDTIKQNTCKNLVSGSSVVKFTDTQKECGFVGNYPGLTQGAFLGVVLPQGVAKSAAAFKYYDGGNPGPLPWQNGSPDSNTAKNLVACDKNAQTFTMGTSGDETMGLLRATAASITRKTPIPTNVPYQRLHTDSNGSYHADYGTSLRRRGYRTTSLMESLVKQVIEYCFILFGNGSGGTQP
ncbi:hypothetical protein AAVH_23615, partial [Aphelenchoides avenae]